MRFPTPKAHLEDWLQLMVGRRDRLVVVYHPDDDVRTRVIGAVADRLTADRLVAQRYKTDKQFVRDLARARGLSEAGTAYQLMDRMIKRPGPFWIDRAELLRWGMLSRIRTLFDLTESTIILSGGDRALLVNTNDRDRGGQWASRRTAYAFAESELLDVTPTDVGPKLGPY